jgi:HEAT repeat protein
MKQKFYLLKLTGLVLILLAAAGVSNARTQQEWFQVLRDTWERFLESSSPAESFAFCYEEFAKSGDIMIYADSIRSWGFQGIQPGHNTDCREQAAGFLQMFRSPQTEDTLMAYLHDEQRSVSHTAAEALLKWGYWDLAAPVLADMGHYWVLGRDPRAVPYLLQGVQSSDPRWRWGAAFYLARAFHDTTYIHQAALDVFSVPGNDSNIGMFKDAAAYLSRTGNSADLIFLTEVAISNSYQYARLNAFWDLEKLAGQGNLSVKVLLQRISDESIDMDIWEQAKAALNKLPK